MLLGYADEHVKWGITDGLRRRGMDVVTAQDRGQTQTDDEILLATATAEKRLMLTNDKGFLRIHSLWTTASRSHAGIVYWRQDLPIGDAIRGILQYALTTTADQAANCVKFL
jgi:hypothetical protein